MDEWHERLSGLSSEDDLNNPYDRATTLGRGVTLRERHRYLNRDITLRLNER